MKALPRATHEGQFRLGKWETYAYILPGEPPLRLFSTKNALILVSPDAPSHVLPILNKLVKHPALKGNPFAKSGLATGTPIRFLKVDGSREEGFNADDLVELCRFLLLARRHGLLGEKRELESARAAEVFIASIAKVGVTALIDEATGYQNERDRSALKKLLDLYLRKEYAAWAKRFPDDFYVEIFRLKGWAWKGMAINRPSIVGTYTRDIVYARLAPNILEELERINPKDQSGNRKNKHHQWMTEDVGHPELNNHLQGVLALMRASRSWKGFNSLLKRSFPRRGDQLELLDLHDSDLE